MQRLCTTALTHLEVVDSHERIAGTMKTTYNFIPMIGPFITQHIFVRRETMRSSLKDLRLNERISNYQLPSP